MSLLYGDVPVIMYFIPPLTEAIRKIHMSYLCHTSISANFPKDFYQNINEISMLY